MAEKRSSQSHKPQLLREQHLQHNTFQSTTFITMRFSIITVALLPFALAAPLSSRQQAVPDLPAQADLADASRQILSNVGAASGRYQNFNNYGTFLQTLVPVAKTLDSTIGADNVLAIDILADRLCIAGQGQGSLCNELIAYAYAWYRVQQYGKTYRELATILGVRLKE